MISVCMPVYNGEKYISEQLDSILAQLGANDEIIISDDNSTDSTIQIIESYNDKRIKIYKHSKQTSKYQGSEKRIQLVASNVFFALSKASGDYIFLSDQDDIWLPDKVETVMHEFNKGYECVLHNNTVINNAHEVLLQSYFDCMHPSKNLIRFLLKCFYQGASMAFTKRILDLSLPDPEIPLSHDHYIAIQSWTHGKKISFITKPLLLYRRHGNNVSTSSEKSRNSLRFKIMYRVRMIYWYWRSRFSHSAN